MEVSNLLSQAVLEASSCGFKHLSLRRPTPAVVLTTPPQKPDGPLCPVDTSSQMSIEEAEVSLEDIPTSISSTAVVSRTGSVTPLVDIVELQANASKALGELLNTKSSIDIWRWRTVWELGLLLHQNESQAATSNKEIKATSSQASLDTWTTCSQLILGAKTNCLAVVKKAKTIRGCLFQEGKATSSKAICKVKAQRVSQAELFHKEHDSIIQDLEEQAIRQKSRSQTDFLFVCQIILYNSPPEFKGTLAASYHILLGQTPPSPPVILPQKTSPMEEQPTTAAPPHQCQSSLLAQKMAPFNRSCGEYAYGQNHSESYCGRTP